MTDQSKDFLHKLQSTFRAEAGEHIAAIVGDIVSLEQANGEGRKALVERVLKTLHTLKGAARAVNLGAIESLCHAMEEVFSAMRAGSAPLLARQFDLLHQAGTLASQLLDQPTTGRTRNQAAALMTRLKSLSEDVAGAGHQDETPTFAMEPPPDSPKEQQEEKPAASVHKVDVIRVHTRSLDTIRYQSEELLTIELGLEKHIGDLVLLAETISGRRRRGHAGTVEAEADVERQCRRIAAGLGKTRRHLSIRRTKLMDAMLETVLVPLSSALDQLPGLVRNLARSRNKQAVLSIQGGAVEIDRRVLDVVREAVIHLVTNAVDHGIEPADKREADGKPATGTVRIGAKQTGGDRMMLTVSDDGAGIDVDAVAVAAVRSGSLKAEHMERLGERQKLQLVLSSGVSTQAEVTQVSGRGVGLAIVAEKLAAVGGELTIANRPGSGCTFSLQLPVRLSTLRGLVLRARGALFVFPLAGLESVRALKEGDIQTVENRETLLLGERVLPAIRLGQLLRAVHPDAVSGSESIALIARAGGNTFALLVDEILSEQEVLPKSLGRQLRRVRYLTGAAQLGDGSLVPILGLDDIARFGLAAGQATQSAAPAQRSGTAANRLLVVEDSITSRLLLKHILEGAGYRVETAVDGLDALSRLRQDAFDAVISDVEMPQLDGLALTERIRANPKTAALPVILVTSLQSPQERERGMHAGADAYVVKGAFDEDNLLKTIRRLI
jgi:two-component system chemotaxis sensor kinase CheA